VDSPLIRSKLTKGTQRKLFALCFVRERRHVEQRKRECVGDFLWRPLDSSFEEVAHDAGDERF